MGRKCNTHRHRTPTMCESQAIAGTFLYYGRAINEISADQSKLTINTAKQSTMLMDYLATYPNAILRFFA
eukprot:7456883-Ditylum_brightwellii.AAC.1